MIVYVQVRLFMLSYRLDVTWKLNKSEGSTENVNEAAFTLIIYLVMRNDCFTSPGFLLSFSISVLEA